MKKIIVVLMIFVLNFYSCKNGKDTSKTTVSEKSNSEIAAGTVTKPDSVSTKDVKVENPQPDSLLVGNFRLIISFYSIGNGAEFKLIQKFEESIGEYSAKVGKNIDYAPYRWGREGETDFCLQLSEITPEQQADFVMQTKELLSKGKWVHLYENQAYRRHPKH